MNTAVGLSSCPTCCLFWKSANYKHKNENHFKYLQLSVNTAVIIELQTLRRSKYNLLCTCLLNKFILHQQDILVTLCLLSG